MARLPEALVDLHRRNNRETADSWERFAAHRARVTQLAAQAAGTSLAVLGAGNCNDLDLPMLAARFGSLHLVDVDQAAVGRARDLQPPDVRDRLVARAPIDLSGALARLPGWRHTPATLPELAALARDSAAQVTTALPDRFDVVLSACFLSQLMRTCFVALGDGHPQLHAIAAGLVLGHMRSLVRLTSPGGTALLVTDVVSSETYPLDETFSSRDGREVLAELVATNNLFAGTSPALLERILRQDAELAPLVVSSELVPPWLWTFADDRTYLVYALEIRRA